VEGRCSMMQIMKPKKVRMCWITKNSYQRFRIGARVERFSHRRKAYALIPVFSCQYWIEKLGGGEDVPVGGQVSVFHSSCKSPRLFHNACWYPICSVAVSSIALATHR
jgi:hypothetical protein